LSFLPRCVWCESWASIGGGTVGVRGDEQSHRDGGGGGAPTTSSCHVIAARASVVAALFLAPNDPAAVGACVSTPGHSTGGDTAHSIPRKRGGRGTIATGGMVASAHAALGPRRRVSTRSRHDCLGARHARRGCAARARARGRVASAQAALGAGATRARARRSARRGPAILTTGREPGHAVAHYVYR
jgi:hypothetical protein